MVDPQTLTIGQTAQRAGVTVATLRYYEQRGLLAANRTTGNQRRYPRHVLRRLAFISAAQRVGLSLDEVAAALDTLPAGRAPTRADWTRLSGPWRNRSPPASASFKPCKTPWTAAWAAAACP